MTVNLTEAIPLAANLFRLPAPVIIKDLQVVYAIRAICSVDATPFRLVFAGGTALARAHKIIKRMSEDVDFKVVPLTNDPISKTELRKQLRGLRECVTAALSENGFDANANYRSRNENQYTVWNLPYTNSDAKEQVLRPEIKIEFTYNAQLRLPTVPLDVSSFVTEALKQPPEVTSLPCVSLDETAAEKLVSLTRRTAMELANIERSDHALVRHIYDIHSMSHLIDHEKVMEMAKDIAIEDAEQFRTQYPVYHSDITGETNKAMNALQTNPLYRERYSAFLDAMVYGERVNFDSAMKTVVALASNLGTVAGIA